MKSSHDCSICSSGTFCPVGSNEATNCSAGTYNDQPGQETCTVCPAGTYQDDVGTTACKDCERGHYCPTGAAAALPCPAGTWSNKAKNVNASQCSDASPGHFAPTGSSKQIACRVDTYNPLTGQSNDAACIACPMHAVTDGVTGAASLDSCVCEREFYNNATAYGQVNCTLCPSGSDCYQAGLTLQSIPIKIGYYRLSPNSDDLRRCPDAAVNCQDSPECPESTSGCRGTLNKSLAAPVLGRRLQDEVGVINPGCYHDLTGTFCRLCAPHPQGKRVYYSVATTSQRAHCRECGETVRDTILIFLGVAVGLIVAWSVAWFSYEIWASERRKMQVKYAWRAFTPHNKLKIMISFYMIATKTNAVYEVDLPPSVERLLDVFAVGISFGTMSVGSMLECLKIGGYLSILIFYMATPLLLAALIVLVIFIHMRCKRTVTLRDVLRRAAPYVNFLLFLAYPLVTNVVSCSRRAFLHQSVSCIHLLASHEVLT